MWNYARRIEIWDLNNRTTRAAGGPDCIWSGMNSGSITAQARSFRDLQRDLPRAPTSSCSTISGATTTPGFSRTATPASVCTALLGWDKLAPESMAMYQSGPGLLPRGEQARGRSADVDDRRHRRRHPDRGGTTSGAYHDDRRMYRTPEAGDDAGGPDNQRYLVDRTPVANVGVVWSQRNTDFFGRDDRRRSASTQPYTGFMHALVRARIPYLPIHVDDIERNGANLTRR